MPTINHHRTAAAGRGRIRTRALRTGPLAGAVVAAVLLAGCGSSSSGGGVAQIKSSTTATSTTKATAKPSALAFSQCMRSHGVPDFPDPNSQGDISISKGSGINPSSPAFTSASNDCKSLNPAGTQSPAQSSTAMATALKFAQCMQKNGVPNYPDPKVGTGGAIEIGDPNVNPNTPSYESAQKKCGSPLPGGKAVPAP